MEKEFEKWYEKVLELFNKSMLASLCEISREDVKKYWLMNINITPEEYIREVEDDWKEISGLY